MRGSRSSAAELFERARSHWAWRAPRNRRGWNGTPRTATKRSVVVSLLTFGIVIGIAWWARDRLDASLRAIAHPHWRWLLLATVFEAASMAMFARMQRTLLAQGGFRLPVRTAVAIVYSGNALSVTLPMAGSTIGTGYTFRRFVRSGAPASLATWALAVSGIFSTCALAALVGLGGVISGNPWAGALGAVLAAAGLIPVVFVLVALRHDVGRRMALRVTAPLLLIWRRWRHRDASTVRDDVRAGIEQLTAFKVDRMVGARLALFATLNWVADCAVLVAAIEAFGQPVPWSKLLVVYGAAIGAASVAVTPAGLGIVEATIAVALSKAGITGTAGLAAAIAYRGVSCWLVLIVGWIAIAAVRRSDHRRAPAATPSR
jgi:uncharacterized protein (TIRG00374 family)